jgi:AcrR family transcriptional regulator
MAKKKSDLPTRERLLDAALSLFVQRGYSATSTQDIIDAAGVTKPVLYHYFESKEALFRTLVSSIYDASTAEWTAILQAESSPIRQLQLLAMNSFLGSAKDPRLPRLLLQTYYGPPISELQSYLDEQTARRFAIVVSVMLEGLAAGQLRGGDANSLALLYCCIIDQHINLLARLPHAASLLTEERSQALVDAFLNACGKGKRRLSELPIMPL